MRNFVKILTITIAALGLASQAHAAAYGNMPTACQQLINSGAQKIMNGSPKGAITEGQAKELAYQAVETVEIHSQHPICPRDAATKARIAEMPSPAAWRAMNCSQATTWALGYMSKQSKAFRSMSRSQQIAAVRASMAKNTNYNPCAAN